ncbi:MAG: FTR1 family protein [Anaerolineae bacterium]
MTTRGHIGRRILGLSVAAGLVVAFLLGWGAWPAHADDGVTSDAKATVESETDHLFAEVEAAVELYTSGHRGEAVDRVQEAFFYWESSHADQRLRSLDLSLYSRLEGNLLELRGLMLRSAPPNQVENKAQQALDDIEAARARVVNSLQESSAIVGFSESLVLILREGFEAILVIAAVLAYLHRTGHGNRARNVYQGAAVGVLASLVTALALQAVFSVGVAGQELLEGITALLAVVVLFYVSHWLIGKVQQHQWQSFLHGKVQSALDTNSGWALGSVAFLAVYREGFETVLFYKALSGFYPGQFMVLAAGFGVGVVLLAAIFGAFHLFQVRIPLRPFFMVTSLILYYLAFSFAGKGIRSLQEAGVLGVTPVEGAPTVSVLGIFPSVETLLAQLVLVVLFLLGLGYTFIVDPRRQQQKTVRSQGSTILGG